MRIKNGVPVDRIELTLDLINARVRMTDNQRKQVCEVLTEQITCAVEDEREACAIITEAEAIHWAFSSKKATEHFKHIASVIRARSEGGKKGE